MLPLFFLATALPVPATKPTLADVLHNVLSDCRLPDDGSVIVCGRRDRDAPYRLSVEARDPGFDVNGAVDSVARERHKLMEVGASGSGSCGSAGAGGWTGCMVDGWEVADQQRGFRPAGRFKKK